MASLFTKVNGIVKFLEDPCGAPWFVYLETAKEPAGKLVLTWFSFGLTDVLRGYFRPRGLRSLRHGRRGAKSGKPKTRLGRALSRVPGLGDDVGDFVGKHLPGAAKMQGRQVSQGVKNVWLVDNALQRVFFWWLVIDLVTDFLYEWTSALQMTEFCKASGPQSLVATANSGGVPIGGVWFGVILDVQRNKGGAITWSSTAGSVPDGSWNWIASASVKKNSGQSAEIMLRLLGTSGNASTAVSPPAQAKGGETADVIVTLEFGGPGSARLELMSSSGSWTIESASIMIQGKTAA